MNKLWAFDIDGTCCNSFPLMEKRIGDYLDVEFTSENTMPYNPQNFGYEITNGQVLDIFCYMVMEDAVPPMSGAVEVLREYHKKTNRLVFITHRHDPPVVVKTREWLARHLELPYELYACHHCEKQFLAQDLGITGFVDDLPEICHGFVQEGMEALCFTAPWHCYVPDTLSGLSVVSSWDEIRKVIL